jgi:hypothetical protein
MAMNRTKQKCDVCRMIDVVCGNAWPPDKSGGYRMAGVGGAFGLAHYPGSDSAPLLVRSNPLNASRAVQPSWTTL